MQNLLNTILEHAEQLPVYGHVVTIVILFKDVLHIGSMFMGV